MSDRIARTDLRPPQRAIAGLAALDSSVELLLGELARPTRAIYVAALVLIIAGLAALPLVRVSVSVQADGVIRPTIEKQEARAPVAGAVARVLVREGQTVRPGEALVTIASPDLDERLALLHSQAAQQQTEIADLARLAAVRDFTGGVPPLTTDQYRREYVAARTEAAANDVQGREARKNLQRTTELQAGRVASQQDVDDRQFQLEKTETEQARIHDSHVRDWETALAAERNALRGNDAERMQLEAQRRLYTVSAAAGGTIEQMRSVAPGAYVALNDLLVTLSPDSRMLAEVYVSPRDIGLIRPGTHVRLLLDAFNYREWGTIDGVVTEVSGDYIVTDQRPVFRVRCRLDGDHVALRNGYVGHVGKGMTFRARFVVADRSLWQLLYDTVDDWMNPVLQSSGARG